MVKCDAVVVNQSKSQGLVVKVSFLSQYDGLTHPDASLASSLNTRRAPPGHLRVSDKRHVRISLDTLTVLRPGLLAAGTPGLLYPNATVYVAEVFV